MHADDSTGVHASCREGDKASDGDPEQGLKEVGGQALLGRQHVSPTPWHTERHGYDPTSNWTTNYPRE